MVGKILKALAALLVTMAIGAAQAGLVDRGGGMIYDSDQGITWLADANFAKTSGYSADGLMPFDEATSWANSLVYGGVGGWRLPVAPLHDPTCSVNFPTHSYGYNCVGGEMGYLFYNHFLGQAGQPAWTTGSPNYSLFTNISESTFLLYWHGNPWFEDSTRYGFQFYLGSLDYGGRDNPYFAWVVHDGDVGAAPEPATIALVGLALAGVGLSRRQRH